MTNILGVGIGAGLVSALLMAVIVKATPLALVLYLLAPIPILIVSLGWSHRAGLVAAATGGLVLAVLLSPMNGLGFVVATALPAWWLAYLALLGRPGGQPDLIEWYPLGRLLVWIALTAALTLTAAAIVSSGDAETFRQHTRAMARGFFRLPPSADAGEAGLSEQIIEAFATAVPAFAAQGFTIVLTFYLWAAARIVRLSGRLPRPWPFIPGVAMPRAALAGLALALVLSAAGGFIGVFGRALSGALVTAFALQGLAVVHDRTRGKAGRGAILVALYLFVALSQGAVLLVLALFGVVDTALARRGRANDAGPRPSS